MRALVFDLDGTLLQFSREYSAVLAETFRTVTGEVRDEWLERYNERFFELFRDCEPQPYLKAFAAVRDHPEPEAFVDTLRELEVEMCHPPADAATDLERLAADYKLGVLTNGVPAWQRHKLRAHGLESYFDAVVVSYEVGAHKPDVAPFRAVETRLPADEYAMIGDADADVDGATNAGWVSHRYDRTGFGDLPDVLEWE